MAKAKMKVFHVLTDKNIGGAGRWLLNYLNHYDRETFQVSVVLPKGSLLIPEVEKLEVPVIVMAEMADKSLDYKAIAPLQKLFIDEAPDVVHTHASLTARMAAKFAKVYLIVHTKHCMESTKGGYTKKRVKKIINKTFSHKIIGVSEAVSESMAYGGVDIKQIVTICNGITPLQPISKEERAEVLKSYGGDPSKKAVGIVARLEAVKDHKTFLLGAKEVLSKEDNVCFYVIGDGSLREKLVAQTQKLGIEQNVIFTGFISDVERMEAALDINVITSKEEALCLSIIETMSLGIPSVGTNAGGIKEVIADGKNGYLVPVGNYKALAEKIELVLHSPRSKYSGHAKHLVERNFQAKYMTKEIERLYLEGRT
ncbi:glycosyltransferase [Chakrabartyella piscis]|uniref:glycosyltransferase n=1 Tax=Chakrabartyella piscis TaxID=2918914 RepID=UPI002958C93B|nr:glycosyltransferase [Chakrabartyella piscis]